jgi:hypothetical protein
MFPTLPTNMYKVFPKVPKKPTTTSMEQLLDEAQMSQPCLEAVKIVDKGTSIIIFERPSGIDNTLIIHSCCDTSLPFIMTFDIC